MHNDIKEGSIATPLARVCVIFIPKSLRLTASEKCAFKTMNIV